MEGLTSAEVAVRIARDGPNRLPSVRPRPWWRLLAAQMFHFFARMLWVAAVLAVVAGLPQLGVAIVGVIVVNGTFSFVQEQRAERAARRLSALLPARARVRRDRHTTVVDAVDLVVDDVVELEAGDRIPADALALEVHACSIDESTLTGESGGVSTGAGAVLFAGTFVLEGTAAVRVTATGPRTRLAGIARLTQAGTRPRSPLANELDRVVRTVAVVAVGVGVGFFGLALLAGLPATDGFLFAVGVTVALVPEGMLPTTTLSLARGAQRMAARHALVRRLESVETLGSTTFVCTDKTGTLTRNEMTVVEVWTPAAPDTCDPVPVGSPDPTAPLEPPPGRAAPWVALVDDAAACCTASIDRVGDRWVTLGDPTETAILTLAVRLGVPTRETTTGRRAPFDPRRRRMSTVTGDRVVVKGAPDAVFGCCPDRRMVAAARRATDEMAERGRRVLAVAARPAGPEDRVQAPEGLERDLELVGLIGLEDPPRSDVADAIRACRDAGIRVAMVTGDHPATARAIADEVGLRGPDDLVVEGRDLPDDDALLGALVDRDAVVVARVDPEQKLRVLRALQARGHVVAMTGDGVNDGPALQEADIGIAMGGVGTDVARAAADLVLLDDHFATIVAAVSQGRATFTNVHRFLTYHLICNVAELVPFVAWALSGGRFPLALGVLQILCLDLGTDLLPALALGAEPAGPQVLRSPPRSRHLIDPPLLRRAFLVLGPTEAAIELAAFVAVLTAGGWHPGTAPGAHLLATASGAAFTAVVLGQMTAAFACRSASRWIGAVARIRNPLMPVAVGVGLALLAVFLWVPAIADLLGQAPPGPVGGAVAATAVPAVVAVDAWSKRVRRRRGAFRRR